MKLVTFSCFDIRDTCCYGFANVKLVTYSRSQDAHVRMHNTRNIQAANSLYLFAAVYLFAQEHAGALSSDVICEGGGGGGRGDVDLKCVFHCYLNLIESF